MHACLYSLLFFINTLSVQVLASAISERSLSVGKSLYRQLAGKRKPWQDDVCMLHWPVVLLYPETMASDLILDFCETDLFAAHIDEISGGLWGASDRVGREKVLVTGACHVHSK